jgi:isopentenyl-diphosphate delta-isomerase
MRRELAEELGVHAAAGDFHFAGRRKGNALTPDGWVHNEFVDVYSYRLDVPLSDLHMQEEEVADLQWVPIDQFEQEVHNPATYEAYVPHGQPYYKFVIAELRQQATSKHKG